MNKNQIYLFIILISFANIVKSEDKCRVLVLEAGGDRGAYHAGAFKQFVDTLDPIETQYDIISGISAGGINAGGISFFAKGDEKAASEFLINWWSQVKRENVWQPWPIFTDFLFHKQGLLDTSPMRAYLTNLCSSNTIKRNFSIGTTDLNKGELLRLRNEDIITVEDKVNMLMSTSAIPILFPHVTWRNTTFADGGTVKMIDIDGGINWCKQQGYSNDKIIVDAVLSFSVKLSPQKDHTNDNTVQQAIRSLDVFGHYLTTSELLSAMTDFPDVDFRYLVIPGLALDNDLFLLFDQKQIQEMIVSGQNDAKNAIQKGRKQSWHETIQQIKLNQALKNQTTTQYNTFNVDQLFLKK